MGGLEEERDQLKEKVSVLLKEKAELQAKVDEERDFRYEEERRRDQLQTVVQQLQQLDSGKTFAPSRSTAERDNYMAGKGAPKTPPRPNKLSPEELASEAISAANMLSQIGVTVSPRSSPKPEKKRKQESKPQVVGMSTAEFLDGVVGRPSTSELPPPPPKVLTEDEKVANEEEHQKNVTRQELVQMLRTAAMARDADKLEEAIDLASAAGLTFEVDTARRMLSKLR